MARKRTQIWSIYGQIDEIVARAMVKEGKLNQLPLTGIPPSQLYSPEGHPLKLAVVVPDIHKVEFEKRIALMYN